MTSVTLVDSYSIIMPETYMKNKLLKGAVLSDIIIPNVSLLDNFKRREDDTYICTFPKSGTHFITEIVYLLKNGGNFTKARNETQHKRWGTLDGFPVLYNISRIDELESPRVIMTHIPYQILPKCVTDNKIIYLARNPKDVLSSYYFFHKNNTIVENFSESFDTFFKRFLQHKAMYTPYPAHLKSFWERRNEPNILFIFYEDLLQNTLSNVKKIAKFLEINLPDNILENIVEYTKFDNMKEIAKKHHDEKMSPVEIFYNKGKIGSWENQFSSEQNKIFDEWISENFKDCGINFTFHHDEN